MADLSQTVFVLSTSEAHAHIYIHTYTEGRGTDELRIAVGDNATRSIPPKNEPSHVRFEFIVLLGLDYFALIIRILRLPCMVN